MTFLRDRLPEPVSYFESQGLVLQRGAKWRTTSCTFHGGSDSMRVNVASGAWVCMSCGEHGGNVLAYQMHVHGQEFVEAAKALGAWQDSPDDAKQPRRRPLPFSPRDALEVLSADSNFAAVAACNVANGVELTVDDRAGLLQAAGRISFIRDAIA
jgi:hypothetical protein